MFTIRTSVVVFLVALFFPFGFSASAQEIANERKETLLSLVKFYEYMLNTVGSESTNQRDKDVIIKESFAKAFTNQDVQIEDDLLEDRKVITNKNINAYLRDVDFFFKDVRFQFDSIRLTEEKKPNEETYYRVSFEKSIEGITLEGNPIKKIQKRFLEVNIDEESNDLKIASVYTTKVSREKELRNWYNSLSFGWLNVFDQYVTYDSITSGVLLELADIDSINLSENQYLLNMTPLAALKNLRYLNISNTKIEDISPIRYATGLHTFIANNSSVSDLSVFSYFTEVKILELRNSQVENIVPIKNLATLEKLDLSHTKVSDFSPIKHLKNLNSLELVKTEFSDCSLLALSALETLNISQSKVTSLNGINAFEKLKYLDVSETNLLSLNGLEDHPYLQAINLSQAPVRSLIPLDGAIRLEKVEADLTNISNESAADFMDSHPGVVVVVNSEELRAWWNSLSPSFQAIIKTQIGFDTPTKEVLIKVTKIDSLDVSMLNLSNLEDALNKLNKLEFLNVSNNSFSTFGFTEGKSNLEVLIAENCKTAKLSGLSKNAPLKYISLKGSSITSIQSLHAFNKLAFVSLDNTNVDKDQIIDFIKSNPSTTIIWRTSQLKTWWNGLGAEWKEAFDLDNPKSAELHILTQSPSLKIKGAEIKNFSGLSEFVNLQELRLEQVGIVNFTGLSTHKNLKILYCIIGPLQSVGGLDGLTQLQELTIANTAVEDLKDLVQTSSIKRLNCSGTNVKKLKGIETIKTLEYIDLSNTNVFKLDRLFELENPKELICYNTRLRKPEVEEFQEKFPNCKVVFY